MSDESTLDAEACLNGDCDCNPRDTRFVYDWRPMRAYVDQIGGTFLEDWVPQADEAFYHAALSQLQAEAMFRHYAWNVKHLFTPATWTFKQRLALAWLFLFGR